MKQVLMIALFKLELDPADPIHSPRLRTQRTFGLPVLGFQGVTDDRSS